LVQAVLLVGCVVLVLYTVTQVFGMNAIVLGRDRQPGGQQP
jgi:Mg2+ and Co2+ transporter CorA